jgi:hypothetical protein
MYLKISTCLNKSIKIKQLRVKYLLLLFDEHNLTLVIYSCMLNRIQICHIKIFTFKIMDLILPANYVLLSGIHAG